jgi:hypothetical protein
MAHEENTQLLQLGFGAILQHAVSIVAELGVADLIERGAGRPVSELAQDVGCHERSLYRCLRFLASRGIFEEQSERNFALTPLAEALRTDSEDSFRAGARLWGHLLPAVGELEHSLRTGRSGYGKAYGKEIFDYLGDHPELAPVFDAGMTAIHGTETPAMIEAYDFSGISTLADVGGGNGSLLTAVLGKYPSMRGLLYDLGHVAGRARDNIASVGLSDRCEVREGNFFESFPADVDAYLMRHIIHDWTDEQCGQILNNCRAVIPEGGRLLVVEPVVPAGNDPSPAKDLDMAMLLFPGGMERTEEEYRGLLAASGFELASVTATSSPVSVIEGRPV